MISKQGDGEGGPSWRIGRFGAYHLFRLLVAEEMAVAESLRQEGIPMEEQPAAFADLVVALVVAERHDEATGQLEQWLRTHTEDPGAERAAD